MKSSARKIELASVDDLFSTEESRQDAAREKIVDVPLTELFPFEGHPFSVRDDDAMKETVESVKECGIVTPVSVQTQFPRRGKTIFHLPFAEVPTSDRRGTPQKSPLCQLPPQNWVASVGTFAEVNKGESLCFQGF